MSGNDSSKPIGLVKQDIQFTVSTGTSVTDIVAIHLSDGSMTYCQVESTFAVDDSQYGVKAYVIRNTRNKYPQELGGYPIWLSGHAQLCEAFSVPPDTSVSDIMFYEGWQDERQ